MHLIYYFDYKLSRQFLDESFCDRRVVECGLPHIEIKLIQELLNADSLILTDKSAYFAGKVKENRSFSPPNSDISDPII